MQWKSYVGTSVRW